MLKETQQLIILLLGLIALASIITNTETGIVLGTVIGILGGFLTGKKIYVDQDTHTITEIEGENLEGDGDVQ